MIKVDGKIFIPTTEGEVLPVGTLWCWRNYPEDIRSIESRDYEVGAWVCSDGDTLGCMMREVKPGDRIPVSGTDTKKGMTYEWEDSNTDSPVKFVRLVAPFDGYHYSYTGQHYWVVTETTPELRPWEKLDETVKSATVTLRNPVYKVESKYTITVTGRWSFDGFDVECWDLRKKWPVSWVVDVEIL